MLERAGDFARAASILCDNDAARADMVAEALHVRALCEEKTRAVSSFNLFQTPWPIVSRMIATAGALEGLRVLEPSAGLGRILEGVKGASEVVAVEQSPECCNELYNNFPAVELKQGDFLERNDLGSFDRVIMNPPFKMGRDIKHIKHAYNMLKPGGLLVALCYDGIKQNRDLKPISNTWEVLPAASFKESGTAAGVVLLTIIKAAII